MKCDYQPAELMLNPKDIVKISAKSNSCWFYWNCDHIIFALWVFLALFPHNGLPSYVRGEPSWAFYSQDKLKILPFYPLALDMLQCGTTLWVEYND
jgi:hypothetical protein